MKLIVGLGNPGKEYEKTRHNIGFIFIDNYTKNENFKEDFKSLYLKKENTIFQKPLTYMNNSGEAISAIMKFYKISSEDLYVIYDDMDLEIGRIRIREKGSSGGHNGIKSIINHIGEKFNRIKIGIGPKKDNSISHVLGKFSKEDNEIIKSKYDTINKLINDIINGIDIEKLKTKYNNK